MPTTTTMPRPLRSADVVMDLIASAAPQLLEHCFMDRSWIWICNVDLRGEQNFATRAKLKEIGFRFSKKPHVMPDGVTLGTWGHSCGRPTPTFRRRVPPRTEDDALAQLAALFE